MPTFEELDALSTKELHDRAFGVARRRLDVTFFWNLMEAAPAAESAAGHREEAEADVLSFSERVADVVNPDTAEEADAFRPMYIEYLIEHGE
ncbi:MAG TPA: hypothetical protein VE754_02335 [Actinomycetota bacterium]|jgi:hypothetical protein|nr:hypothetical protein [Actinomycetota bacterium]